MESAQLTRLTPCVRPKIHAWYHDGTDVRQLDASPLGLPSYARDEFHGFW